MMEVARGSVGGFLKRVEARAAAFDDPAEKVVEMFVYTLERLPKERYLGVLPRSSFA